PASPPSPARLSGAFRVVVHTVEGHVKRGLLEDADLGEPAITLAAPAGAPSETIPTEQVKTIFFMLAPGERPPLAEGQRVRVTFRDGRQVAGFSPDYREGAAGFFMIPADTRTNTGRIWVYASAVKTVSVG
ncbi:MAG TPA: chemotaxis protein CheA, partial [Anaeromyxobacteraceae bacterium]|nr:chemotaxis protein CheA [Anaeromyxobacteraceae bacterium]